jgi:glycosyltransferase involved in cell wall biosynthesis
MDISVCLASYNGEKYILKQIQSIMNELDQGDELIVVDDCSVDSTLSILGLFADSRIKIYSNAKNIGEVGSFNRAISIASKKYIFLADQDDMWFPGRVSLMRECIIQTGADLVTGNLQWIDNNDVEVDIYYDGVKSNKSRSHLSNILDIFIGKTNYFGCAMAFDRKILQLITPIPNYVESHDLWIALVGNLLQSNAHIDEIVLLKRRHSNNMTSTNMGRSIYRKIFSRYIFIKSIIEIKKRCLIYFNN